ncbi:hypothetical protein [Mesorhizobium sp. WSM3873]|uniref:hypothetical protein n=1 Tax=Mesorhizobium sp. WSM3873 TaxID=1854056 RepID=UPI0012EA6553|nr:hypothetical protein [Mesorhizobium sp. WSM3873]
MKKFFTGCRSDFLERKRSVNSAMYNSVLEMKKYSEKIEKSRMRWHSEANQRSGG